ncbi:outer membrane transport energization protein TonB [Loktanella fryxellensis]|uniref:Outer membrane transport energization protein TonB n=1 Tax=Loktanella fryxellensis TaxID=245187 RepID=A0A1H8HDC7_9RHOB|nr:TonB family protein [Loktanella fryxellensis]SEN54261.1 outer membrane transport energization protein TonB [Loktanella fryxellensis]
MSKVVERAVFGAVALGLHLGALSAVQMQPAGAQGGAGNGGDAMISLAAVDGTVAEMVADWDRPPVLSPPPAPVMPPPVVEAAPLATTPPIAPAAVTAPQMPSLPQMPVPDTDAPALPAAVTEAPPPPEPEPTFAPVVTARPVERPDRPAPEPEPVPEPVRQAEAPPERQAEPQPQAQSQQAQPGQRAAGQGGGAVAGNAGTSEAASAGPAARSSLMADWGGTIRSRIERRKSYPRAAGGATGTVQVAIRVGGDGRLVGLGLAGSSGNAALDQAALDAVQRAGSFPAAPADLGAGPHDFTLPMSFGG